MPEALDPPPTISSIAARAIVLDAAERGLPPPELHARFGLDPEAVADVDGRIPARVMRELWEQLPGLFGEACFGLRLGERLAASEQAFPWHLVRASATLGEGLTRIVALWRVFNDVHPPELVTLEGRTELRMRTRHTSLPSPRHATEFAFVWFVEGARRATGKAIDPLAMRFEHPAPADTSEHERLFRCPLEFDADATALVFPHELLDLPTVARDPELAEILQRHGEALLAKLPPRGARTYTARVRDAMVPLLPSADVTIERIAAALDASPRSVQRKLGHEGTTFQRVLDELRRELAMQYLGERTHPIAEIAILLGFSDQSTFHRAFVRWTGRTPGEVRKQAR